MTPLANARVLMVGMGGLGAPASRILVESGVSHLTLLDDDRVELSNLQRQILFSQDDVGTYKTDAARASLEQQAKTQGRELVIECIKDRLLPSNALELIASHDLVVEGADNYATKFLASDACALTKTPHVSGGALRFDAWAFATNSKACLRCVFEEVPSGGQTCDDSGVLGPVVGVAGSLQALLAVELAQCDSAQLAHYTGLNGRLRFRKVRRRPACRACNGELRELDESHYVPGCTNTNH